MRDVKLSLFLEIFVSRTQKKSFSLRSRRIGFFLKLDRRFSVILNSPAGLEILEIFVIGLDQDLSDMSVEVFFFQACDIIKVKGLIDFKVLLSKQTIRVQICRRLLIGKLI